MAGIPRMHGVGLFLVGPLDSMFLKNVPGAFHYRTVSSVLEVRAKSNVSIYSAIKYTWEPILICTVKTAISTGEISLIAT